MNQTSEKESIVDTVIVLMIVFLVLGGIAILMFYFSYINILSYLSGGLIAVLNFVWLKRLIKKFIGEGKFTKKSGLEWGLKILIIFGVISLLILRTKINILIFIFGLSILPLAVILQGLLSCFKIFGGR